jgi:hypothetical protein
MSPLRMRSATGLGGRRSDDVEYRRPTDATDVSSSSKGVLQIRWAELDGHGSVSVVVTRTKTGCTR